MEHLLLVSYYSKFIFVRTIHGPTTSSKIAALTKQICGEHGIPEKIVPDNGLQFTGTAYQAFVQAWGIKHVTSSPRYPQSNGMEQPTGGTPEHTEVLGVLMAKSRTSL